MIAKVYVVKRDGTRICVSKAAPKSEPTFAERVANAKASMDKLGLDEATLLRMKRRIEWRRQMYKPFGA